MTIFMSYARENEAVVKTLARAFEAARRDIWYDHDLNGGDIWWPTILDHIRSCTVFLFALSDTSLESRACLLELDYAEKLGRPVLPVRVGQVVKQHGNPLVQRQFVQFRPNDAVSGFEVLAAADRSAERCPPLPEPLPPEPPIPFAYLRQIAQQIEATELGPRVQLDVIDQLRRALAEETDRSVRQEIVEVLRSLVHKPWRTNAAGLEINATLTAHRAQEEEIAQLAGDPTETVEPLRGPEGDGPRPPDPAQEAGPDPDPVQLFLSRIAGIDLQRRGVGTGAAPVADPQESPEEIFARRTEEVFAQLRAGAAVREARESGGAGEPDEDPPPRFGGVGGARTSFFSGAAPSEATSPPAEGRESSRRRGAAGSTEDGGGPAPPEHDGSPSGEASARTEQAEPLSDAEPHRSVPSSRSPMHSPPTRRALGVLALLLSVGLGALAGSSAEVLLVVPFVVSAMTAIVALRFSAQVGRRFAAGDIDGARSASHTAMVWEVVALTLIVAVVGLSVLAAVDSARP
jgi:hypothetical protein